MGMIIYATPILTRKNKKSIVFFVKVQKGLFLQKKQNCEQFINSQKKSNFPIDILTFIDYYIDKVKDSQSQIGRGEENGGRNERYNSRFYK